MLHRSEYKMKKIDKSFSLWNFKKHLRHSWYKSSRWTLLELFQSPERAISEQQHFPLGWHCSSCKLAKKHSQIFYTDNTSMRKAKHSNIDGTPYPCISIVLVVCVSCCAAMDVICLFPNSCMIAVNQIQLQWNNPHTLHFKWLWSAQAH